MSPLFDRLDNFLAKKHLTESELEMIKLAIVELAQDDPAELPDAGGTDGRCLVLHAQDALTDAGIELDGESGEDQGGDE